MHERRASQQLTSKHTHRPLAILANKQTTNKPLLFTSAGASEVNPSTISGGKIGGYKVNLPGIEHRAASAFRQNTPPMIPKRNILISEQPLTTPVSSGAWQRFKENYIAVTNEMDTMESLIYNSQSQEMAKFCDKYNVGTRINLPLN